MVDTQDAQVMPVTCKKHFCGAAEAEAGGGASTARPGLGAAGAVAAGGATSCPDTGEPAAVCAGASAALSSPAGLPEQLPGMRGQKPVRAENGQSGFHSPQAVQARQCAAEGVPITASPPHQHRRRTIKTGGVSRHFKLREFWPDDALST